MTIEVQVNPEQSAKEILTDAQQQLQEQHQQISCLQKTISQLIQNLLENFIHLPEETAHDSCLRLGFLKAPWKLETEADKIPEKDSEGLYLPAKLNWINFNREKLQITTHEMELLTAIEEITALLQTLQVKTQEIEQSKKEATAATARLKKDLQFLRSKGLQINFSDLYPSKNNPDKVFENCLAKSQPTEEVADLSISDWQILVRSIWDNQQIDRQHTLNLLCKKDQAIRTEYQLKPFIDLEITLLTQLQRHFKYLHNREEYPETIALLANILQEVSERTQDKLQEYQITVSVSSELRLQLKQLFDETIICNFYPTSSTSSSASDTTKSSPASTDSDISESSLSGTNSDTSESNTVETRPSLFTRFINIFRG